MKRFFESARGIIGIILIIVAIAGIYGWEAYGREQFTYDQILVLREDTEEGTVITKEQLIYVKVSKDSIIPDAIVNPELVIGQATTTYLPALTQLVPEYFEDASLVLDEGEYVLSIPSSWIVAYPQTLRRLDTAYFYAIYDRDYEVHYDANGVPIIDSDVENAGVVCKAVVAYAKDGANQEIYSADSDRLSGTGNVSLIEIICNMEDADTMAQYIESGYKFVILYN